MTANPLAELMEAAQEAALSGDWGQALDLYEEAFSRLPAEGDADSAAELLRRIGTVHHGRGDMESAAECYEASLAIAEANGLEAGVAQALNALAGIELQRGELDEAEQLYGRVAKLARELKDVKLSAKVDQNLGTIANIRGDTVTAVTRYRSSLDRYRTVGDVAAAAGVLNNLGMAHVDVEGWAAAGTAFEEALKLAEEARDVGLLATVDLNRAELFLKRQHYEDARVSCDRALELFRRLCYKRAIAEAYKFYGVLYRDTGNAQLASVNFSLALGLAAVVEDRLLEAEAQSEWSLLHIEEGRHREALQSLNRALRLFEELRARRELHDLTRRLEKLQVVYEPTVRAWGAEVVASDPFRAGRGDRVATFATALGEAVGLDAKEAGWLRVGAFMHDVGTAAVPQEILQKPGRLSPGERELVQSHAVIGDTYAGELDFPDEVRSLVRHHHEHWNGAGYPDRLAGEEIPLTARVLAVADVFDALTSPRSYRPAHTTEDALAVMDREAGTVLDPEIYNLFRGEVVATVAA